MGPVTVAQIIDELLNPLTGYFGVVFRALGALALGYVAGQVLRFTLAYKFKMRFYVPLIFVGLALLLGALAFGQWGSPGSMGMFGVGVFAGYMFLRRSTNVEVPADDDLAS